MPLIAFLIGLAAMVFWTLVLLLPLAGLFAVVALIAMALGTAANAAAGMGVSVLLLPVIIYLPVVLFSYLVPALARLLAHLVNALISTDGFTPAEALGVVTHYRQKFLAMFGLARRPPDFGT